MSTTLTLPDKKADKKVAEKYVKGKVSEAFCDQVEASDEEEDFYQTAEEFYEELREAIHEVNEAIAGRKKLQTLGEFLDELESEGWERFPIVGVSSCVVFFKLS